ncbi:MAG: hypothetical protein Kow0037_09850 [Calditrichia bacterium]
MTRYRTWLLTGLLVMMAVANLSAKLNADSLFTVAIQKARAGERQAAIDLCRNILDYKPGYHDVRVFLGRVLAWEKRYDEARQEFKTVLEDRPDHQEALIAITDLEYWAGNIDMAILHVKTALKIYPNEEKFLIRYARLLLKKEQPEPAANQLEQILERNPSHPEALKLLSRIKKGARQNKLSVKYNYDAFDRKPSQYGPWRWVSAYWSRRTAIGTVILRANYANRFFGSTPKDGLQYEIEAYPKVARGFYFYLNAGYSKDTVFPKWRAGGEAFKSLPFSFEASAGFRYLQFKNSDVTVYTGSLGKYYKSYWFSLRTFLTPKNVGTSVSGFFLTRRYFSSAENYLELSVGIGSSPVEVGTKAELDRLDSRKFSILWQKPLGSRWIVRPGFGYEREEYRPGKWGDRFSYAMEIFLKF